MVPSGWLNVSLGSLFEFKNGLNTEKEHYGSGFKFVNVMDVFKNDVLTESMIIGRVKVTQSELESYRLKYGDVLFNRTSETFSEIAMAAVYLDEAIATFGGFVIRGRPTGKEIDPYYSSFLFQSSAYRNQAIKLGQGAVRANIGQKDLSKIIVSLPSIIEQQKIAAILSTWDKAITTTEQLLANSQQQKKALMQQLLTGKKRLLDENGERFRGEWRKVPIGSILKEVKRPVEWDDGTKYKLLSVKRRSEGVILREVLLGSDILTKKMNVAYAGDFLISKMQVVHGASGLVPKMFHGYHVSDSYISLVPKDANKLDILFFSWLSKQKVMYHQAFLCSYGVHIEKMTFNFKLFLKTKVLIPQSLKEQQKIAAVLAAADEEISALQQKIEALKQEKKALMQQLLTGKRRVKVDEVAA